MSWEPKPPGTLWDTPGLLRDCFTFTFNPSYRDDCIKENEMDEICSTHEGEGKNAY